MAARFRSEVLIFPTFYSTNSDSFADSDAAVDITNGALLSDVVVCGDKSVCTAAKPIALNGDRADNPLSNGADYPSDNPESPGDPNSLQDDVSVKSDSELVSGAGGGNLKFSKYFSKLAAFGYGASRGGCGEVNSGLFTIRPLEHGFGSSERTERGAMTAGSLSARQPCGAEMAAADPLALYGSLGRGAPRHHDPLNIAAQVYTSSTLERARRKNLTGDANELVPSFSSILNGDVGRHGARTISDLGKPPLPDRSFEIRSQPASPWVSRSLARRSDGWLRGGGLYEKSSPGEPSWQQLSEAESMESLSSAVSSHIQAQLQRARASGNAMRRLATSATTTPTHGPRSASIPPLPLAVSNSALSFPSSASTCPNEPLLPNLSPDAHLDFQRAALPPNPLGSTGSLISSATGASDSIKDEKQAAEIRKLRRDLETAQERVTSLSSQLSTNAHVVLAFEQSLSNMTQRLQHLSTNAEQKDSELSELRNICEWLRSQAGIGAEQLALFSPGLARRSSSQLNATANHTSSESLASMATSSETDSPKKRSATTWLRTSFSRALKSAGKKQKSTARQDSNPPRSNSDVDEAPPRVTLPVAPSTSVPPSPMMSQSAHSLVKQQQRLVGAMAEAANGRARAEPESEVIGQLLKQLDEKEERLTAAQLEALSSAQQLDQLTETLSRLRDEMLHLRADNDRLQRLVHSDVVHRDRDLLARPGSGNSGSQSRSSAGSDSLPSRDSLSFGGNSMTGVHRLSLEETIAAGLEILCPDSDLSGTGGQRLRLAVCCYYGSRQNASAQQSLCHIGTVLLTPRTKWDLLDCMIKKVFNEYEHRIDSSGCLELSTDSIQHYQLGEVVRRLSASKDALQDTPELLPCGYLVGEHASTEIRITLKGGVDAAAVDSLVFETLVPRSALERYAALLREHRRVIFSGPSGVGKSYLAEKLAFHLVQRLYPSCTDSHGRIVVFVVGGNNGVHQLKVALREHLDNADANRVLIVENLHLLQDQLDEAFSALVDVSASSGPFIVGTMTQTGRVSATNLQLHHNFRWVLCGCHMEPVRGLLQRFLRRKLIQFEVARSAVGGTAAPSHDLLRMVDWLPKVWRHVNKFIEAHAIPELTIGPRLFLACPIDWEDARAWFQDVWNFSLVPYMLEAAKTGVQTWGRRSAFEDPTDFVLDTYPWSSSHSSRLRSSAKSSSTKSIKTSGAERRGSKCELLRLRAEDVGLECDSALSENSASSTSGAESCSSGISIAAADDALVAKQRKLSADSKTSLNNSNGSAGSSGSSSNSNSSDPLYNVLMIIQEDKSCE